MNDKKKLKFIYLIVLVIFLGFHLIVFREALFHFPEIWRGDEVIAREELIPIFDFESQFLSQISGGYSSLTSSKEVRVGYTMLTSWVRYVKFLPLALVLLNTLAAFLNFYAFFSLTHEFFLKNSGVRNQGAQSRDKERGLTKEENSGRSRGERESNLTAQAILAFAAAFFVHALLLYTKVTHFYSLIIGFSLFSVSLSWYLAEFYLKQKTTWKKIMLIAFSVLINPAIHYHVLFYIVVGILFLAWLLGEYFCWRKDWAANRAANKGKENKENKEKDQRLKGKMISRLKRKASLFLAVILISAVPYAAFILLTAGAEVSQNIPVNYISIKAASVDILHLFSLDSTAQIDMQLYGSYLAPKIRIGKILLLFLAFSGLFFAKKSDNRQRRFLMALYLAVVLSLWMSFGYKYSFSFHYLLSAVQMKLAVEENFITLFLEKIIFLATQILRLPHRFQLVNFYFIGILLTINSFIWVEYFKKLWERLIRLKPELGKKLKSKSAMALKPEIIFSLIFAMIMMLPIAWAKDYRETFLSGNFNNFIKPWPVLKDLKQVKKILENSNEAALAPGKLIILPSFESGREVCYSGYGCNSFLDKYYLYYLDQPAFYYGTSSDLVNKNEIYLVLRSILDEDEWWPELLEEYTGVEYILVNKEIAPKKIGNVYLENLESSLKNSLKDNERVKLIYSGAALELYQINKNAKEQKSMLNHLSWEKMQNLYLDNSAVVKDYHNAWSFQYFYRNDLTQAPELQLAITDDPQKLYLDLFALYSPGNFFESQKFVHPFDSNLIFSTTYSNTVFSLFASHEFQQGIFLEPNVSLNAQYTGLKNQGSKLTIPFEIKEKGEQVLALRQYNNTDLKIRVKQGRKILWEKEYYNSTRIKIVDELNYLRLPDIFLGKGEYSLEIINENQGLVIIDGLLVAPTENLPNLADPEFNEEFMIWQSNGEKQVLEQLEIVDDLQEVRLYQIR